MYAEMTFTNRALQPMGDFAIQLNKNRYVEMYYSRQNRRPSSGKLLVTLCVCFCLSFGIAPQAPLQVQTPLMPNQSTTSLLLVISGGAVQKTTPLTQIQVAIKNNIDVFYFAAIPEMSYLFTEDGRMGVYNM